MSNKIINIVQFIYLNKAISYNSILLNYDITFKQKSTLNSNLVETIKIISSWA
jgi:hypothetical protein